MGRRVCVGGGGGGGMGGGGWRERRVERGIGWPCFPYKGVLVVKGQSELGEGSNLRSQQQGILVNSPPNTP